MLPACRCTVRSSASAAHERQTHPEDHLTGSTDRASHHSSSIPTFILHSGLVTSCIAHKRGQQSSFQNKEVSRSTSTSRPGKQHEFLVRNGFFPSFEGLVCPWFFPNTRVGEQEQALSRTSQCSPVTMLRQLEWAKCHLEGHVV